MYPRLTFRTTPIQQYINLMKRLTFDYLNTSSFVGDYELAYMENRNIRLINRVVND